MALLSSIFFIILSLFVSSSSNNETAAETISAAAFDRRGGKWVLLQKSIGVSAMHMQVLKNNRVIIFDRTNVGPSNLTFPSDKKFCLNYTIHGRPAAKPHAREPITTDCTAHSLSYDFASNTLRPLIVHSDTWCSSGAVDPTGTLVQTGGFGNGTRTVRTIPPCEDDKCDWLELDQHSLMQKRWYASSQILPDGRAVVVGGRKAFTYEFFPRTNDVSHYLKFLWETADTPDKGEENNLYPFLHLLPDGNLFLFANNRSVLLDFDHTRVIKEFPVMPGGVKRNYPSSGSSVLLPLKINGSGLPEAEVLICGGAELGSYIFANRNNSDKDNMKVFKGASTSCGRIKLTDPDPKWAMETLPMPRVMSDMLLLPTGDVIIINGASNGTAGWECATNPVLNPVLYKTYERKPEARFSVLNPSTIPRMYHSSAVLLPDGRILVGGSNPHERYNFRQEFPTELSLEAYVPAYLDPKFNSLRPTILSVESRTKAVSYGLDFGVKFQLDLHTKDASEFSVALVTPSFTTHSYAMNQRMVVLEIVRFKPLYSRYRKSTDKYDCLIVARGPPKNTVAPPGYYTLFLVHSGIPSHATWVKVQ
ncbi:aldehyde oxidase GLOX-like [Argentina anserina]|uniref:aldehyde oxidase GLOX-like n=1 Tax=Argentina anserina TaxID=57926 RepID=UPI002176864A|nr:aldehyde oxidase GLOX-like [Potentilla anserina]